MVAQLLPLIDHLREEGTTIILVEQSVNLALAVADTAYFMERGQIRFHGPTRDLLERPDLMRSVFIEGASEKLHVNGDEAPATEAAETMAVTKYAPDGPALLESCGVSVAFGGNRAVDDVSFEVLKGEVLGIIGPNGAGKTTLFDLLSGYLRLDAGAIHLNGRDITSMGPASRAEHGLGRSFQDAALFSSLTVEQTIAVGMRALDQGARPDIGRLPPAERVRLRTPDHGAGPRAGRSARPRRAPHEVHPRAVDGHEARRRPRLPARAPTRR